MKDKDRVFGKFWDFSTVIPKEPGDLKGARFVVIF
jgi:hypothetical protein